MLMNIVIIALISKKTEVTPRVDWASASASSIAKMNMHKERVHDALPKKTDDVKSESDSTDEA